MSYERREEIIRRLDRLDLRKETDPTKTWCPYCGALTSEGCAHLTDHGTYQDLCAECLHEPHHPKPCAEWIPNHTFGGGLDKRCPCTRWEEP